MSIVTSTSITGRCHRRQRYQTRLHQSILAPCIGTNSEPALKRRDTPTDHKSVEVRASRLPSFQQQHQQQQQQLLQLRPLSQHQQALQPSQQAALPAAVDTTAVVESTASGVTAVRANPEQLLLNPLDRLWTQDTSPAAVDITAAAAAAAASPDQVTALDDCKLPQHKTLQEEEDSPTSSHISSEFLALTSDSQSPHRISTLSRDIFIQGLPGIVNESGIVTVPTMATTTAAAPPPAAVAPAAPAAAAAGGGLLGGPAAAAVHSILATSIPLSQITKVKMVMDTKCKMGISFWPMFSFKPPERDEKAGSAKLIDSAEVPTEMTAAASSSGSSIEVPSVSSQLLHVNFTQDPLDEFSVGAKFLGGIPFPFITIRTTKLEGTIDPNNGAVVLLFEAQFLAGFGKKEPTALTVNAHLTTEPATAFKTTMEGKRLENGRATLVSAAEVPKTSSWFANILLWLPTAATAKLPMKLEFS